jgi:ketosteroid isomerase-like protein
MKTRVILLTVLIVVLMLPFGLYAQETDPVEVCYGPEFEAFMARESAFAPAIWADDAVQTSIMGDMVMTYSGKEEIRAHLEELVADEGFAMEVTVLSVEGDTVTVESRIWDSDTRALGVAPLVATEVCVVEDGKIKSTTWTMSDESLAALGAALAALPETGGKTFPAYAWVLTLGGMGLIAGISLKALRRRA